MSNSMTGIAKNEIENLLNIYEKISKNNRGDFITPSSAPSSIIDPYTGKEYPVYSQEEAVLIEDMYQIEDQIREFGGYLINESNGEERVRLKREIDKLEAEYLNLDTGLIKSRAKADVDADKEAKIRRKNNKERMAKKKAKDIEKMKEDRKNAEELAERQKFQKLLDEIPDDLKDIMNRIF